MAVGFQFQVNGLGKSAHIEMPTQLPKTPDQFVYSAKGRETINLGLHPSPYSLHRVVFRRIGWKKEKINLRKPLQISLYLPAGVNTRIIQYNGQGLASKSLAKLCQKQDKGIRVTLFRFFPIKFSRFQIQTTKERATFSAHRRWYSLAATFFFASPLRGKAL